MKKALLTSIAALLLATGTAHAYCRHDSFFRCGNKLINVCDFGREYSFYEIVSKEKIIELPSRAFRMRVLQGELYFRGQKCSCLNALMHDNVQAAVSTRDEWDECR